MAIRFPLLVVTLLLWPHWATGDSSPASALSPSEFSAVIAEAMRRARGEDALGLPWEHLDEERLGRLLVMPEFTTIDRKAKSVLIDQAGTWDLLRFDRPSQSVAPWIRWYPERKIGVPVTRDFRGSVSPPSVAYADRYWGDESGASIALLKCMPSPVWVVQDDEPMLAALERLGTWDQPNAFDFGSCVRQQDDSMWVSWPKAPEKLRGLRSAAVLEKKLATFLLSGNCTDHGPDSCLVSLHALVSLNSRLPELVSILRTLEPRFALTDELPDPATAHPENPWSIPWESLDAALEPRRKILRKIFFLSAKIPVLLDQAQAWPDEELANTLEVLTRHVLALDTVTIDRNRDLGLGRYRFASPWKAVIEHRTADPRLPAALARTGTKFGALGGCLPHSAGHDPLPPELTYAYVMTKRQHGLENCGVLPYAWIAQEYFEALRQRHPDRLKAIDDAKHLLVPNSDFPNEHTELMSELRKHCDKSVNKDPWRVCTPRKRLRQSAGR